MAIFLFSVKCPTLAENHSKIAIFFMASEMFRSKSYMPKPKNIEKFPTKTTGICLLLKN